MPFVGLGPEGAVSAPLTAQYPQSWDGGKTSKCCLLGESGGLCAEKEKERLRVGYLPRTRTVWVCRRSWMKWKVLEALEDLLETGFEMLSPEHKPAWTEAEGGRGPGGPPTRRQDSEDARQGHQLARMVPRSPVYVLAVET